MGDGATAADHWRELVAVAMLGTDRRNPPEPTGVIADLVDDTVRSTPSERMLAQVAATVAVRRAGVLPGPARAPIAGPDVGRPAGLRAGCGRSLAPPDLVMAGARGRVDADAADQRLAGATRPRAGTAHPSSQRSDPPGPRRVGLRTARRLARRPPPGSGRTAAPRARSQIRRPTTSPSCRSCRSRPTWNRCCTPTAAPWPDNSRVQSTRERSSTPTGPC